MKIGVLLMTEYHNDCVRVSSGRSCFLFLINNLNIKKLYVPYYNCNVITRLLDKTNIELFFL